jgi:hypothetical protein
MSDELDKNMIRMKTPWHSPVSIEAMFQQIEDGVKFATARNDAPSANTIIHIGYNIIYATGRFTIGCHEWRKLTDKQKMWAHLKTTSFQSSRHQSPPDDYLQLRRIQWLCQSSPSLR